MRPQCFAFCGLAVVVVVTMVVAAAAVAVVVAAVVALEVVVVSLAMIFYLQMVQFLYLLKRHDGPMDGRTYGQTESLIEMRGRILKRDWES